MSASPSPAVLQFLSANARWLAAGFLLALASSFGQTFFIAIFAAPFREEFGLSHGEWGAIYMIGTLASAAALIQLGRSVDSTEPRKLAMIILFGLAAVCLGVALVGVVWLLPVLIFGLRFFGQGMLSHLSQTLMAKWFVATRGRAVAIASLGYPTGEALAPLAAVALIALIDWRMTWLVAAGVLTFVAAPAIWALLARDRAPTGAAETETEALGVGARQWTRGEAIRSQVFWLLLPAVLAPGFIITVVFFLPNHIADIKGWSLEAWAGSYSAYAVVSVMAAIAAGWAIDRYSARRLLMVYQLPMAMGLITLALGESALAMTGSMILFGASAGATSAIHAALWAEVFGSRHLGAIKALGHAVMVASSAAGPGITGAMLDLGVRFETQCLWMAGYVGAISLVMLWAQTRLR